MEKWTMRQRWDKESNWMEGALGWKMMPKIGNGQRWILKIWTLVGSTWKRARDFVAQVAHQTLMGSSFQPPKQPRLGCVPTRMPSFLGQLIIVLNASKPQTRC